MDRLYALGVSCIEFLQDWFADSENYFEWVNDLSNPHYVMEYLFPFVSTLDSVFAAQLLLCMSFGGWLNSVMKWWLLEDRPYWWVRETSFYEGARRPQLRQFRQTCETGPGSPSGHSTTVAMLLMLAIMWISHIMNDRKCYIWWWKYIVYPLFACALGSVMLARMFVATHFPHQTLMGALVGSLLAPALCIYVCDPYVWGFGPHARSDTRRAVAWHVFSALVTVAISVVTYFSLTLCGWDPHWTVKLPRPYVWGFGPHGRSDTRRAVAWHVFSALVTVAISVVTYFSLTLCGWDPHWTVKLAFRWCENPEDIHVSTTPMYALVQATASMLGWALAVTPAVAQFRHYTKNRSLILSGLAMYLLYCGTRHLQENIDKNSTLWFYSMQFLLAAVRPFLYLRVVPTISMLPYPSVGTGKHKRE